MEKIVKAVLFSEEQAAEILKEKEIAILIDLNQGEALATAWGCDLTGAPSSRRV